MGLAKEGPLGSGRGGRGEQSMVTHVWRCHDWTYYFVYEPIFLISRGRTNFMETACIQNIMDYNQQLT